MLAAATFLMSSKQRANNDRAPRAATRAFSDPSALIRTTSACPLLTPPLLILQALLRYLRPRLCHYSGLSGRLIRVSIYTRVKLRGE